MGALCGFPVGAVSAVDLYSGGKISKEETERLLTICNNTGPSFLVGIIGNVYWNRASFGVMLYIVQIVASVILGIISSLSESAPQPIKPATAPVTASNICAQREQNRASDSGFLSQLSSSISAAAVNMVVICGFIVFFSAVTDLIFPVTEALFPNSYVSVTVASLMEFSSAAKFATGHSNSVAAAAFTAFSIGWAGVSVHSQTAAFTSKHSLNLRRYYKSKFIQGLICASAIYVYAAKSNISPAFSAFSSIYTVSSHPMSAGAIATNVVFTVYFVWFIAKKRFVVRNHNLFINKTKK